MVMNRCNTWVPDGKKELAAEELDDIFTENIETERVTVFSYM